MTNLTHREAPAKLHISGIAYASQALDQLLPTSLSKGSRHVLTGHLRASAAVGVLQIDEITS
jgi:hypothetical protein